MRSLKPIKRFDGDVRKLVSLYNHMLGELNRHKEEIRQIKSKLRVNAHFKRK